MTKNPFTNMGAGPSGFPSTNMGMVEGVQNPDHPNHHDAVERLCSRYWSPVYRFIRPWWTRSNEDAKDLTQSFLLSIIDSQALVSYDPAKGSFRNFIKVLLRRWLRKEARARGRKKRGGGLSLISLEEDTSLASPGEVADPDSAFDEDLVRQLVGDALEQVRTRYAHRGRGHMVEVFEAYDLGEPSKRPTYSELAERFNLKVSDVRNALYAVREAVRQQMRVRLAHMTPDTQSLEEEWSDLMG